MVLLLVVDHLSNNNNNDEDAGNGDGDNNHNNDNNINQRNICSNKEINARLNYMISWGKKA